MQPELSVVIPTHNRPAGLATVLGALRSQTLATERFEVVVVDDGSQPEVRADGDGLRLRVIRHAKGRGPAAARNAGWQAAQAPLIAFTDDDCTPTPDWLTAIMGTAQQHPGDLVVQGPVEPTPEQSAQLGPLSHTIAIGGPSRLFVTANIAYSRGLLERLGGFDEWFKRACGEDVDLGARATKAGAQVIFSDRALVRHEVRNPGLWRQLHQTVKWTDSVRTLSLHPELRGLFFARLFWKPSHPLVILLAAGLATRRARWAAAAALPYLEYHRRRYRGDPPASVRTLPAHLAIDACEVGTMVAGSIRHRTPAL